MGRRLYQDHLKPPLWLFMGVLAVGMVMRILKFAPHFERIFEWFLRCLACELDSCGFAFERLANKEPRLTR